MLFRQPHLITPASFAPLGALLQLQPPHQITGFDGPTTTLQGMVQAVQGPRGEASMLVRGKAEEVIGELWPKDYVGEIGAINNWVASHVRYVNDPMHVELLKDPQRLVEEIDARGYARGDCDDMACLIGTMALQVGRHAQFVVVGFGAPGQYTHVFCRVQDPRSGKWIVCDPVAGSDVAGMLKRVTTYEVWSADERPEHGPVEKK